MEDPMSGDVAALTAPANELVQWGTSRLTAAARDVCTPGAYLDLRSRLADAPVAQLVRAGAF
jgi:hypothetical protein